MQITVILTGYPERGRQITLGWRKQAIFYVDVCVNSYKLEFCRIFFQILEATTAKRMKTNVCCSPLGLYLLSSNVAIAERLQSEFSRRKW